jgi:hypothetical protein
MVIGFSLSKMSIMTIFSFIRIRYVKTTQLGFGEGREDRVVFGDQVGRDQFKTRDALDSFGVEVKTRGTGSFHHIFVIIRISDLVILSLLY